MKIQINMSSLVINFSEICRACMHKTDELQSLFSGTGKLADTVLKFSDILMELACVNIFENDNLPAHICSKCVGSLFNFYQFKQDCQNADAVLRKNLIENKSKYTIEKQERNGLDKIDEYLTTSQQSCSDKSVELKANIAESDAHSQVEDIIQEQSLSKNLCTKEEDYCNSKQSSENITCDSANIPEVTNCNTTRRKRNRIKLSIQVNTKSKKHQCDICGQTLSCKSNLEQHQRKHTGERPFPCDTCGKCFRRIEHVVIHKRTHTGERPHQCKFCHKAFSQHGALACHLRTHTGEKPHICAVCGKAFSQSVTLTYHMRTHTGETPYVCSICKKGFSHSGNLKIHMRFHSGERPYTCTTCEQTFVTTSHLNAHLKTHTGEKQHICYVCGKAFARREHLRDHLLSHTGAKPHACKLCPKRYTQSSHLNRHMKTHNREALL